MFLRIIQISLPGFIKKRKLKELFRLTADAFQCDLPVLKGISFTDCLSRYALFTKEQAEVCLKGGNSLEEVKDRLYHKSYGLGRSLRKSFHIKTLKEAVIALKLIYKHIGIELQSNEQGEIIIHQCFFSKYYSGEVCKLISYLDEGLAAGLSGGGRLSFTQRITEGCSCCKASFKGDF